VYFHVFELKKLYLIIVLLKKSIFFWREFYNIIKLL